MTRHKSLENANSSAVMENRSSVTSGGNVCGQLEERITKGCEDILGGDGDAPYPGVMLVSQVQTHVKLYNFQYVQFM